MNNTFYVENFKNIGPEIKVEKRPITINIGTNNSGKSTFSKCIEAINKTIINYSSAYPLRELHTFGPNNLGSEILNSQYDSKYIGFGFDIPHTLFPNISERYKLSVKFQYWIPDWFSESTKIDDNNVIMKVENLPGKYTLFKIALFLDTSLLLSIEDTNETYPIHFEPLIEESFKLLRVNHTLFLNILNNLEPTENFDYPISEIKVDDYESAFSGPNPFSLAFQLLNEQSDINFEPYIEFLKSMENYVDEFSKIIRNYNFIYLNRIITSRKINFHEDGRLSKALYNYFTILGHHVFHNALDQILPLFDIDPKIKITPHPDYGFIIHLKEIGGEYRNLEDFGSGIKQLFPLALISTIGSRTNLNQVSWSENFSDIESTIFIEEPEVNLHPNFQSKLADFFMILNSHTKMEFVIETHSEYLVRRFQYLVGNREISSNDIVINYFWKEKEKTKCKQIFFEENGSLSDSFNTGFYDESLTSQLELLIINNSN